MSDPHSPSAPYGALRVGEISHQLDNGELTSRELVSALIERAEALDHPSSPTALNSLAAVSGDALDVAARRDEERAAGRVRGALHGVPVVIKDNVEALGLPGLAGSTALIGRPSREAPLVARLRDAGAVVLASTNLSQWANIRSPRSTSGYSASGGLVANPWSLDRSAGGSSSGSGAAVAAGLAPLAVGTETNGSITCPAAFNGVVGLKPTVGVVPVEFVVPISASQDSPGPMGRSVDDVARLFAVLSATTRPPSGGPPRLAAATNWRTGHFETDQLFDEAVAALRAGGVEVVDRELAIPGVEEFTDELCVLLSELVDDLSNYLAARPGDGVHSLAEVVAYEDANREREQLHFGHEFFLQAIESGGRRSDAYLAARPRNLQWATATCLGPALEGVDAVIAPSFGPPWKSDFALGDNSGLASPVTTPSAIAGWPILSLPMGLVAGLPVGLAIVGRAHDEWRLLEVAGVLESVFALTSLSPTWRPAGRG